MRRAAATGPLAFGRRRAFAVVLPADLRDRHGQRIAGGEGLLDALVDRVLGRLLGGRLGSGLVLDVRLVGGRELEVLLLGFAHAGSSWWVQWGAVAGVMP